MCVLPEEREGEVEEACLKRRRREKCEGREGRGGRREGRRRATL